MNFLNCRIFVSHEEGTDQVRSPKLLSHVDGVVSARLRLIMLSMLLKLTIRKQTMFYPVQIVAF